MKATIYRCRIHTAVLAMCLLQADAMHAQPAITQRPSDVTATMANSRLYTGVYQGTLKSRMCGETDPMYTGSHTYLVEYPDIDDPATIKGITDVRFSSTALVGGAKETDKFHVSITVSPSQMGGSPPAYVVDTTRAGAKVSGKATLQVNGGTSRLSVSAVNELGETLQLTVVCKPKS
jgi:hypothetical protein